MRRVAIVDFESITATAPRPSSEQQRSSLPRATNIRFIPARDRREETGLGNVVNVPLRPGGRAEFRRAFTKLILPALDDFRPDFILVSAGFDAHRADPLAGLELEARLAG